MLLGGFAFRHRFVGILIVQLAEQEGAACAIVSVRAMASGKRTNSRAISVGPFRCRSALTASRKPAPVIVHFSRMQVSDVEERPAFRRMIENVIDGDERRSQSLAELGQQTEPARLVTAVMMSASEERAPGRDAGHGGEAFGEVFVLRSSPRSGSAFRG